MAKKTSGKGANVKKVIFAVALLLGIGAICMLFVPAIKLGDNTTYTGLQAVFGYTEKTNALITTIETEMLKFSFMNLLTYIFVIAGIVFSLMNVLRKKPSVCVTFVSAALFIVSAVFFFLAPQFIVLADATNALVTLGAELTLGVGSIIGGILAGLAGVCTVASLAVK